MVVTRIRLFASCYALPIGMLYAITLGISLLLGTLFSVVLVPRLERSYRATEHLVRELMHKEQVALQAEAGYGKMGAIAASKDRHMHLLACPYTLPHRFEASRKLLFALYADHGLHIMSYEPQVSQDKGWYVKHACTLVARGTFEAIVSFFDVLAHNKHLIACKRMSIVESQKNELLMTAQFTFLELKGE
jgi:hypothetical protein